MYLTGTLRAYISRVLMKGKINTLISCMIAKLTMLTLLPLPKAFLWLGIIVRFAKSCSSVKHLYPGFSCLLSPQPKCKSRSDPPGRIGFKCETRFVVRSQDCLNNHIETRHCSLYCKCSSSSSTKPRHYLANHRCSKKRCCLFAKL